MRENVKGEMRSIWNSLEAEVKDDIRRKRYPQLYYRLNLILHEMTTFSVPRESAEAYIQERIKPHNIIFVPDKPTRGRIAKKVG